MNQNTKRLCFLVAICSVLGIGFGATTSQASINDCLAADSPTQDCLTQDPLTRRIEGMSTGLVVGVCAAIGASWGNWKQD